MTSLRGSTDAEVRASRVARVANLEYYERRSQDFAACAAACALDAIYAPFLKLLPTGARILDAGCGSGRDAAAFAARGLAVKAIDNSAAMVGITRSLGIDADVLALQDLAFESEFDGIWACASLLHIPKHEVADVLFRLFRASKLGGVLFASLKEGNGESFAEDRRYFVYYQLEEFAQRLVEAGWQLIDVRRSDAPDPRLWLNYLATKTNRPPRGASQRG